MFFFTIFFQPLTRIGKFPSILQPDVFLKNCCTKAMQPYLLSVSPLKKFISVSFPGFCGEKVGHLLRKYLRNQIGV